MMCPKCGKLIEGSAVRCPDCGTAFDLQYAPPRIDPGPSMIQQTQPTVIPKNVPISKMKRSSGWWVGVIGLSALVIAALVFALLIKLNLI